MHKALIVESVLVLALLLGGCAQPGGTGDQNPSNTTSEPSAATSKSTAEVTSETRNVSGFNEVELDGSATSLYSRRAANR